jgi:hypothetical protein
MTLIQRSPWPLLWSDSEIAQVVAGSDDPQGTWHIRLAVAQVRPPETDELGYARGVLITLTGVTQTQTDADGIGRLAWARLTDPTASAPSPLALTLPGSVTGPLRLELAFANGTSLQWDAQALRCDWAAEVNFRAALAC